MYAYYTKLKEPEITPIKAGFLFLLCAAWLLTGLIGHDPWKPDEAYGFGLIYHIIQNHDWIVPTLAGEPYLDKPPLYYWTAALFAKALRTRPAAARWRTPGDRLLHRAHPAVRRPHRARIVRQQSRLACRDHPHRLPRHAGARTRDPHRQRPAHRLRHDAVRLRTQPAPRKIGRRFHRHRPRHRLHEQGIHRADAVPAHQHRPAAVPQLAHARLLHHAGHRIALRTSLVRRVALAAVPALARTVHRVGMDAQHRPLVRLCPQRRFPRSVLLPESLALAGMAGRTAGRLDGVGSAQTRAGRNPSSSCCWSASSSCSFC